MFDHMIPLIYWSIENVELTEDLKMKLLKNFPINHKGRKIAYNTSCNRIKRLINGNNSYIHNLLHILKPICCM